MFGDILLWVIILFPLIIGVGFRVGTSHLFFSLMAGELLSRYFAHDLELLLGSFGAHGYGEVVLILVPMWVTAYVLRWTVSKRRIVMHVLPLLVMGAICAAFVLPTLPEYLQIAVSKGVVGKNILHLNRLIVGAMVMAQLVYLWVMQRRGSSQD